MKTDTFIPLATVNRTELYAVGVPATQRGVKNNDCIKIVPLYNIMLHEYVGVDVYYVSRL